VARACCAAGKGSSGAETNYDLRLHELDFGVEPGAASCDLQRIRLLVNAPLASRLPLEVFDGIGDVRLLAIDARLQQSLVQQRSRRPDEGLAFPILFVARLLPHEYDFRVECTFSEDGLRSALP